MLEENHHAMNNMARARDTYKVRNAKYGNNYKRFGQIMMALYPHGLTIDSFEQWNRLGILHMIIAKLSRYVTDPKVGHLDSIHDIGVYAFMLEELDAEAAGLDVTPPEPLVTTRDVSDNFEDCQHIYKYPCHKEHQARRCKPATGHLSPPDGVIYHLCGKPTCITCGNRRES